ncbi:MAG: hypothetical protein A2W93_05375 [Bacteroidetes bacterium GWF2_43_63]|nr:MAG: hypothetical protein A2W94_11775 [Bacteroidetes bacterium GWE2_42_42]OFY56305.1 MAG: hypothetical protein A2W93_05375 [Bacteroidetes bacterium GWF2_43_63]HBG71985.1 hypothetical protein [Bacteroidales bacterium]HCB61886.1 hypothetical protein [Bacteroidales bacterium]HCY23908.1 hypothetical protein [Bacteroidales bacterium]
MKNIIVLTIVATLFFVSCRPAYVRRGVKDIRSERLKLDEAKQKFEVLDTAQVHEIYLSYLGKIDSINKYFKDQYSEGAWKLMTEFGQLKKPLKTYFEQYGSVEKDYSFALEQLADLEYDLKSKNISKELFLVYINQEKDAIGQLIMKSNLISDNAVRNVNHYNQISPKIDSLVIVFKAGLNK